MIIEVSVLIIAVAVAVLEHSALDGLDLEPLATNAQRLLAAAPFDDQHDLAARRPLDAADGVVPFQCCGVGAVDLRLRAVVARVRDVVGGELQWDRLAARGERRRGARRVADEIHVLHVRAVGVAGREA